MFFLPLIPFFLYREISGLRISNSGESEADINPIYYMHIPKAGSSFATAIAHLACGSRIGKEVKVSEPSYRDWKKKCGKEHIARFTSGHRPLDPGVQLRTVVTLVRPARQRIISGYFHSLHDCPELQKELHISENPPWKVHQIDRDLLLKYGNCVQGCASSMLSGHGCATGKRSLEDLQADAHQAVAKIPQIGFVGLTNHWDLTVCMWHAKYGGECLEAEFANVRPGKYSSAHDETIFDSSFHPIDDAIYDAAALQFMHDMKTYDVSPKTCARKFCPNMAQLFHEDFEIDHAFFKREHLDALTWEGRQNFLED